MNTKKGFFILEALISIVIFTVLLLSLFSMVGFLQNRVDRSVFESDAGILVQEGTEIARTALLSGWNKYSPGVYHPVFDEVAVNWILLKDEETGLQARYTRGIQISPVCRSATGERIDSSPCTGQIDIYTKAVTTTVSWVENGENRELSAELLVLNMEGK